MKPFGVSPASWNVRGGICWNFPSSGGYIRVCAPNNWTALGEWKAGRKQSGAPLWTAVAAGVNHCRLKGCNRRRVVDVIIRRLIPFAGDPPVRARGQTTRTWKKARSSCHFADAKNGRSYACLDGGRINKDVIVRLDDELSSHPVVWHKWGTWLGT